MAATRSVRRNNKGQFAGASGGTKVTIDRSGGFANASFRARVAQGRAAQARRRALTRKAVRFAAAGVGAAAAGAAAKSIRANSIGDVSKMRAGVRTAANIVKGRSQ